MQRGFLTPKVARPDVYRAANLILRMANDGRLLLVFKPIGFFKSNQEIRTSQALDLTNRDFFKECDSSSDMNDSGKDGDSEPGEDIATDHHFTALTDMDE